MKSNPSKVKSQVKKKKKKEFASAGELAINYPVTCKIIISRNIQSQMVSQVFKDDLMTTLKTLLF